MLKNFFITAWRNFLKFRTLSFINIIGLSIGLVGCLALLLFVFDQWSYDRQFSNARNIYMVYENQSGSDRIYSLAVSPATLAPAARQEIPGVVRAIRLGGPSTQLLSFGDKRLKQSGMYADSAFFSMLNYRFLSGNPATALLDMHSIVLSQTTARRLFGDANPMGKTIRLDNASNVTVSGVIEDVPSNETLQFSYMLPWSLYESDNKWITTAGWGSNNCVTLVELSSPATFASANAAAHKMIKAHFSESNAEAFLHPMLQWHLYSRFNDGKVVGGEIEQVRLFALLALGLLLIACINFMNLSTARSQHRAREVGIRKAIGSSRGALIRQFLLESWVFVLLASVIALLLMEVLLPKLNQLLYLDLHIPYGSAAFWTGFILLVLLTGFIAGSYPSLYLSSFRTIKVLKGIHRTGKGALRFRQSLVTFQFVLTLFLIISTAVIYSQLNYIRNRPIGYDQSGLVEIPLEGPLSEKADVLKNELLHTGAVSSACRLSNSMTFIWRNGWGISWPGKRNDSKDFFDFLSVGYDFAKTTGIQLLQGRDFSREYLSDSNAVLINQAAAELMHLPNPVGARIIEDNTSLTIIGVFKDFVSASPFRKVVPMVAYLSSRQNGFLAVKLSPSKSITASMNTIQQTLKKLTPDYPTEIRFVDQDFERKYASQRRLGILSTLFGSLTILISCLGLFGLIAFAAEQRTKEIGIRKVLGARSIQVVQLLSADYLRLIIYASLIAFPLSWLLMNNWLQQYDYRVSIGWWIFAGAWLLTTIIVMATISSQALKAALSNPAENLRSE